MNGRQPLDFRQWYGKKWKPFWVTPIDQRRYFEEKIRGTRGEIYIKGFDKYGRFEIASKQDDSDDHQLVNRFKWIETEWEPFWITEVDKQRYFNGMVREVKGDAYLRIKDQYGQFVIASADSNRFKKGERCEFSFWYLILSLPLVLLQLIYFFATLPFKTVPFLFRILDECITIIYKVILKVVHKYTPKHHKHCSFEIESSVKKPKDNVAKSDLFKAVLENDIDMVDRCLRCGISINARKNNGITPLMLAVSSGNIDMVVYLAKLGANPAIKGPKGLSAVDIALRKQYHAIVRAIQAHSKTIKL